MSKITRKQIIELCEKGIVNHKKWDDRDSASAHKNIGFCWALLKAGCKFRILKEGSLKTDKQTIWIEVTFSDFMDFENLGETETTKDFYIPTALRLREANGGDWY